MQRCCNHLQKKISKIFGNYCLLSVTLHCHCENASKIKTKNQTIKMEHQLTGIKGTSEGEIGNVGAIILPIDFCQKIETALVENDLVDETTVLNKFHLSKKSIRNYICAGKLKGCYTKAFNNTRWYFMSKLLGIKNLATRISNRKKIA